MNTVKSYVKELRARITGDKTEVIVQKNYRKATAALKSQVGTLQNQLVDAEGKLEEALDQLEEAKYPTELISNPNAFISKLASKQADVTDATDKLVEVQESIEFYSVLLKEFEQDVEDEPIVKS